MNLQFIPAVMLMGLFSVGLPASVLAYMSDEAVVDQVISAGWRQQPKVLESLNRKGFVDPSLYRMLKRNYEEEKSRMASLAPRLERDLLAAARSVSQNPSAPAEESVREAARLIAKTPFEDEFILAINKVKQNYKLSRLVFDAWAIVFEERYLERDAQLSQQHKELAKLSKRIAAKKRDLEKQAAEERSLANDPARVAAAMHLLSSRSSSGRQAGPSLVVVEPSISMPSPTAPVYQLPAAFGRGSRPTTTQRYGNSYFSSDGSTTQKFGNSYFHSDGTTTQRYGNTYYNSDGTRVQRYGNTYFSSDGSTTQKIGNSYFHSDGTMSQRVGNTIFNY